MQPADHSVSGVALIVLNELRNLRSQLPEGLEVVALIEISPLVSEYTGLEYQNPFYVCLDYIHLKTFYSAN